MGFTLSIELVSVIIGFIGGIFPIILVSGRKFWIWFKYREVQRVYSVLTTEILLGNIKQTTHRHYLDLIHEIAKTENWDQIQRICEQTIHLSSSTQRKALSKILTKATVDKYYENWEKLGHLTSKELPGVPNQKSS